jgi:hypothetical protein
VRILKTSFLVFITVVTGGIVLSGYFLDVPFLVYLRGIILKWAVILTAVALLVGIANLLRVHGSRVLKHQAGSINSLSLIFATLFILIVVGYLGPTAPVSLWVFNFLHVPVESSIMALLAVTLTIGMIRMLNRRMNQFSLIFIVTVLIILVGAVTFTGFKIPGLIETRSWLSQVPAVGGMRGILLGVALGILATGLRVLMGVDRPYGD